MKKIQLEYVSNITFAPIAREIKRKSSYEINIIANDLSQHMQRLNGVNPSKTIDVLIVHFTKEMFLSGWGHESASKIEVDLFNSIDSFLKKNNLTWVITNTIDTNVENEFVGKEKVRMISYLHGVNLKIASLVTKNNNLRMIDASACIAKKGSEKSISIKNDMVMKLPYRTETICELASEYIKILDEIFLPRKKVILVDADNTLWGGVLGEDGASGIKVDPITYPGVAYWRFQEQLKKAKKSGIILALVSKNNDEDIIEVFNEIQMPLKLEDFTIRRVNWQDKASNIKEIANQLNLGVDSFVFIDDNIFEIEQVRYAIPNLFCYEFPGKMPECSVTMLEKIPHLTAWDITAEDSIKTDLYAQEVKRSETRVNSSSLEEYLKSLQLKIEFGVNRSKQIGRIAQLTNKTNQFNLTTRRYTESDIQFLMQNQYVYDFRVLDRFGDMGIVGVCIVKDGNIDVFLMSCRALGREVESTMLQIICKDHPALKLTAEYIKSKKNQMVSCFFENNGFLILDENENYKSYVYDRDPEPKYKIEISRVN